MPPLALPIGLAERIVSGRVGLDVGGTLAKITFVSTTKPKRDEEEHHGPIPFTHNGSNYWLAFKHLPSSDPQQIISFLTRRRLTTPGGPLRVTGGGALKFYALFERELKVKVARYDEMQSLMSGLSLALLLPNSSFIYDLATKRKLLLPHLKPIHWTQVDNDPVNWVHTGEGLKHTPDSTKKRSTFLKSQSPKDDDLPVSSSPASEQLSGIENFAAPQAFRRSPAEELPTDNPIGYNTIEHSASSPAKSAQETDGTELVFHSPYSHRQSPQEPYPQQESSSEIPQSWASQSVLGQPGPIQSILDNVQEVSPHHNLLWLQGTFPTEDSDAGSPYSSKHVASSRENSVDSRDSDLSECRLTGESSGRGRLFSNIEESPAVENDIYPFLLVNIGSGVSVLKAKSSGKFERVSGTCIGGGLTLGLAKLCFGAESFAEVAELSLQGCDRLDLTVSDVLGDTAGSRSMPPDTLASSFGRLYVDVEDEQIHKADVARSVIRMVSYNLGYLATLLGQVHQVRRIFFSGKYIHGHQFTMQTITQAVVFCSQYYGASTHPESEVEDVTEDVFAKPSFDAVVAQMQRRRANLNHEAIFLRYDGYLGALGALIAEHGKNPNLNAAGKRANKGINGPFRRARAANQNSNVLPASANGRKLTAEAESAPRRSLFEDDPVFLRNLRSVPMGVLSVPKDMLNNLLNGSPISGAGFPQTSQVQESVSGFVERSRDVADTTVDTVEQLAQGFAQRGRGVIDKATSRAAGFVDHAVAIGGNSVGAGVDVAKGFKEETKRVAEQAAGVATGAVKAGELAMMEGFDRLLSALGNTIPHGQPGNHILTGASEMGNLLTNPIQSIFDFAASNV